METSAKAILALCACPPRSGYYSESDQTERTSNTTLFSICIMLCTGFQSHFTGCLGEEEEKKGKGRVLVHFLCLLNHHILIYCLWLCEADKMLFAQPTDSIF